MYFTEEEKEIIKKIAKKDIYSLNNFFEDNCSNRKVIQIKSYFSPTPNGWNNFSKLANLKIEIDSLSKEFRDEYIILLTKFIKIWSILEKCSFIVDKSINQEKIKENFKNFVKGNSISVELCIDYEVYCTKEMLVIQEQLKDFITNDFKTKDEIHMEKALKSADKSFKVSLWIAGISIFLSILSISVSVLAMVKESEVKVKNLSEIKIEKLNKQLETTNKELEDIKGLLNQKKKI